MVNSHVVRMYHFSRSHGKWSKLNKNLIDKERALIKPTSGALRGRKEFIR